MQISLDIDDDVVSKARAVAATQDRALGAVISEMARRGIEAGERSRLITLEDVKRIQEEIDEEDARRALMLD